MYLDVGNGHKVSFELYGNPGGIKVLFLHGGPGLGYSESDKSFFDPTRFQVLFMDQRGCGKSLPKGNLMYNTTQNLIDDIVKITDHLEFGPFVIFGGSWGATLAILFAAQCPRRVKRMILRGTFSGTTATRDIYLRGDIRKAFPASWERFSRLIPKEYMGREAEYVFETLGKGGKGFLDLGYEWARYGFSLSRKSFKDEEIDALLKKEEIDLDRIRIELHYALNGFFIEEGHVYKAAQMLKDIPVSLIHGRYDHICPLRDIEEMDRKIPNSKLTLVDAGHSMAEEPIRDQLFVELDQLL